MYLKFTQKFIRNFVKLNQNVHSSTHTHTHKSYRKGLTHYTLQFVMPRTELKLRTVTEDILGDTGTLLYKCCMNY